MRCRRRPTSPWRRPAASRGGAGESQSLTVPMAVCNTLILELSRIDGGHSLGALDRLLDLRTVLAPDGAGRRNRNG